MQSIIKTFKNQDFGEVRTVIIDGEPYFVGKDVATILGYVKSRNAIQMHIDAEDKKDALIQGEVGGTQKMTVINESGLYSLILSSKLENAKKFKRWVTHEVIPEIRKTGIYSNIPKTLPEVLRAYANEVEKNELLKEENETLEIALNISNKFYTVAKYNKEFKKGWSMKTSQRIGKEISAYCKYHRIEIRVCETNDERFGKTNSYPLSAWDSFFNAKKERKKIC